MIGGQGRCCPHRLLAARATVRTRWGTNLGGIPGPSAWIVGDGGVFDAACEAGGDGSAGWLVGTCVAEQVGHELVPSGGVAGDEGRLAGEVDPTPVVQAGRLGVSEGVDR